MILICGYFRAAYGLNNDIFSTLHTPIVERFNSSDQIDEKLRKALAELLAQELGSGAMSSTLLKQVLIMVFRRSHLSVDLWANRFSFFSDRAVAKAFATMAVRLDAAHSTESLAKAAGLSRSAFMTRFKEVFRQSPIAVLRDLRMRKAKALLNVHHLSLDEIAQQVGYSSHGSFLRAFKKSFGVYPGRLESSRKQARPKSRWRHVTNSQRWKHR